MRSRLLLILAILALLNCNSAIAYSDAQESPNLDESATTLDTDASGVMGDNIIEEASSTTPEGVHKALTPLQRRANELRPLGDEYTSNIVSTLPPARGGLTPTQLEAAVVDSARLVKASQDNEKSGLPSFTDAAGANEGDNSLMHYEPTVTSLSAVIAGISVLIFLYFNRKNKRSRASTSNTAEPLRNQRCEAQQSTFMGFLDWQEAHIEKKEGLVFFKSQATKVVYFNFLLGALDRLADTIKMGESASEFMEGMSSTLASTLFSSSDEAIRQLSSYGVSEDENIILANKQGHEAMGIFLNITTTEHPVQTLGIKGYMLNDLLIAHS